METLYYNKFSSRYLCLFRAVLGLCILAYFIGLIQDGVNFESEMSYTSSHRSPNAILVIGPILGFGLFINGLTASRIQCISYNLGLRSVEIVKLSLFREKLISIPIQDFKVDLRSESSSFAIFPKIRLMIINGTENVEEIKNNLISMQIGKIKRLYLKLRDFRTSFNEG